MTSMDDSDSDFEDIGGTTNESNDDTIESEETNLNHDGPQTNAKGKKVRGKDIEWLELVSFDTVEEYNNSDELKMIKDDYTKNRTREWDYGTVEVYTCRYSRRAGYNPCKWQLKVTFKSNSQEVTIEKNVEGEDHVHEVDEEYDHGGTGFRWTLSQTEIVIEGMT